MINCQQEEYRSLISAVDRWVILLYLFEMSSSGYLILLKYQVSSSKCLSKKFSVLCYIACLFQIINRHTISKYLSCLKQLEMHQATSISKYVRHSKQNSGLKVEALLMSDILRNERIQTFKKAERANIHTYNVQYILGNMKRYGQSELQKQKSSQ